MVPPEKLASVTPCKPPACRRCHRPLEGDDPDPLVHQVAEWPVVEPVVREYRRHRLRCTGCGETTCGVLPPGVPAGAFGPRLQATLGLLSGAYRLSKRQVQRLAKDLIGLRIAVGMIAKLERQSAATLEDPVEELRGSVVESPVVHIDETSWRQDRKKAWLWVTATARATVFTIAETRGAAVARRLLGTERPQVIVSDRFPGYDWIAVGDRQVCWAHLRRDFQAMIDRGGVSGPIGRELLDISDRLFRWWHRVRDGTLERPAFARLVGRVKSRVVSALARGERCGCGRTEGTCTELRKVEPAFWSFVGRGGIEPTNYSGPRKLDHRLSYSDGPRHGSSDGEEAEGSLTSVQGPGRPGRSQG